MNSPIVGVVVALLVLIGGVVGTVAMNTWSAGQQSNVQSFTGQQITSAEGSVSGG
ncbi:MULTISPECIES: hypothetical protein [Alicyclobacillus]|uniref:Uncharacterized protein n=2 Tax=Alicyclobacillus TaxID=29330 RepID=C8WY68_ALIAD|nr:MULTISPECIES: hypothetical protein [Alicyclobacillus]ACV59962.1 hypothetical protein Aaci_2959 [Alicyclobacillus acidocaldarius subsp. acidocaldarius DSM 446]MBF8376420.1 hypothetical protein [Alicyclobacillus mali (ex Roth et al. 2021)]